MCRMSRDHVHRNTLGRMAYDAAAAGASGWESLVLDAAGRSRDELSLNEDWNLYQEN